MDEAVTQMVSNVEEESRGLSGSMSSPPCDVTSANILQLAFSYEENRYSFNSLCVKEKS